ncbi:hypothetical protein MY10362_009014 [Beauveria mimosiformis]
MMGFAYEPVAKAATYQALHSHSPSLQLNGSRRLSLANLTDAPCGKPLAREGNEFLRRRKQHIYNPKGAKSPRITVARVMARKLTPTPEAVLTRGIVGTGGLDDVQDAESAEEGKAVIRELFAIHRGVPEGAGALPVELKLECAAGMTVFRFAGMSDGGREGQPAVQADGATLSFWTDGSVLATTCAAGPERHVCAIT